MSLKIPKGKVTVIIGSNGCGKSILLKTILRIIQPKLGDVLVNGNNTKTTKEKILAKQIASLPQSPVCPAGLTVFQLVA